MSRPAHPDLGDNAHIATRFRRHQLALEDQDAVDQAVRDSVDTSPVTGATAAGDSRKLRGIPAIGHGVSGVTTAAGELGQLMAQRPGVGP